MTLLSVYKAFSDESRLRLVKILSEGYFNVQELTSILGLSQPTVSHHLKTLQTAGVVKSKRNGTWIYYSLSDDERSVPASVAKNFLEIPVEAISGTLGSELKDDLDRLRQIEESRREKSRHYFDSVAREWKSLRQEAANHATLTGTVASLVERESIFLELGCGSGALLEEILPREGRTIAVDNSEAMLSEAKKTLGSLAGEVDFRLGYLEHLPVGDDSVDHAAAYMVLHHVSRPEAALKDASRVLKPGGRLTVVDLTKHTNEMMREQFADVWLGFEETEMLEWMSGAGFVKPHFKIFGEKREIFLLEAFKP